MNIKIPPKLEKHLADDTKKWSRCVAELQAKLDPILSGAPEFFPEYTDHGFRHVNTVLELADKLIPKKALGKNGLTPRDVACLIAAILIHDLGMFVGRSGVNQLMTPEWDAGRVKKLDERSWSDDWKQYLSTIRRMPDAQKLRCFGTVVEADDIRLDKETMVRRDQLVIGEFLRRNHPRLAHEIAVAGFPGSTTQQLLRDAGFDATACAMIGLMARSHGMSLRKVEAYLGPNAYPSNIPVYYLMSVLRLADLLDASENRAPMIRLKQEELDSPLSREEWALNQCFSIDSSRWYPETKNYTIQAQPETSSEYARLESWLNDVQSELDLCWSILAQKHPDSKLKLSIHRVLCTMHEPANYDELRKQILPREVRVTANPEIVKLLMEPLYGDDPTYGVRELLQNAVDACLERQKWEADHGNEDYEALVDIRIDGDVFTITDNGMGMNEDILLDYYLCAGSSYRSSEGWRAANAPEGESQVARTGKFGVGFLAAFLLGDKIEVHTQHISDDKGLKLAFTRESMPLDVKREVRSNDYATTPGDQTGTTITIRLNKQGLKLKESKDWLNWYAFDEPRVEYRVDGKQKHYNGRSLFRDPGRNTGWFDLSQNAYEAYQWTPNMNGMHPELYCNGIRIENGFSVKLERYGLEVCYPHVSLIDKRAALDVDLSRRNLKSFSEAEALYREVFCWHIARLLLTPWDTEQQCRRNLTLGFKLRDESGWGRIPFLLSTGGYSLNYGSLISTLSPEEYVVLYYAGSDAKAAIQTAKCFLDGDVPYAIVVGDISRAGRRVGYWESEYFHTSPGSFVAQLLSNSAGLFGNYATKYDVTNHATSVWLSEKARRGMPTDSSARKRLVEPDTADGIHAFRFSGRWSVMPIRRDCFSIEEFPVAVHLSTRRTYFSADSLFAKTFRETLTPSEGYAPDDYWIPFDMEEREKKFKKAFTELKDYIDYLREHPEE